MKERGEDKAWDGRLILDAGDMFRPGFSAFDDKTEPQTLPIAEFIVEQFNAIGCDGVTLGDRDLGLGLAHLKKLRKKAKFPFLVANLLDWKTEEPIFEERHIVEVAGVKVGVFGVTAERAPRGAQAGAELGYRIASPLAVAKKQVAALEAEGAQIIVALAHLRDKEEAELARALPRVSAILGGDSVRLMKHPELEGGTFIADGFSKGKYLSVLTLHLWKDKPIDGKFEDRFARQGIEQKINQLDQRLKTYTRILEQRRKEEATQGTTEPPGDPKTRARRPLNVDFYEKQVTKIKAEKQLLELELEETPVVDGTNNYIAFEAVPLAKSITHDEAIEKAVVAFRAKYPKKKGKGH